MQSMEKLDNVTDEMKKTGKKEGEIVAAKS